MKKRLGFVSNSSSSSFIISIGEITNKEKFNEFITEYHVNEDDYEFMILTKSKFIEMNKNSKWGTILDHGDWAGYYGGGDTVKDFFKKNPVAEIYIKIGTGPDDDYFFYDDDDYCDYDKIELDDFNVIDVLFYNGFNGVNILDNFFGAGRNG